MTQFARPDATITAASWTASATTLHGDTSDQSNATYMTGGSSAGTVELNLGNVTDPASSADHVIYIRVQGTGTGGPERFSLSLLQGATVIAAPFSAQSAPRGTWTEYSYTLIGTEADAITDYTDLRVQVTPSGLKSGETVLVSEVWLQVPDNTANLVPADVSGVPTVDAVTLSQTHILTVADVAVTASADAPVITQSGVDLVVANVSAVTDVMPRHMVDTDGTLLLDTDSNQISADSIDLAQSGGAEGSVIPNDARAAASADNVTLTQTHNITVADASAAATVDGDLDVVVTFEISQFDGGGWSVAPTADNVTLVQTHILTVADVSAAPTADAVVIGDTLQVADVSAVATADGGALVGPVLVVADARTIGRIRNLEVDQVFNLSVSDMSAAATFEGDILLEQFFSGVVGLTLDTRTLTLTLDDRTLTLTIDTRTGG